MGKKLHLRQNWNSKTDTIVESDTIGEATISGSSVYIYIYIYIYTYLVSMVCKLERLTKSIPALLPQLDSRITRGRQQVICIDVLYCGDFGPMGLYILYCLDLSSVENFDCLIDTGSSDDTLVTRI